MEKAELQDLEIPTRVAFVNVATGKIFFDCHPAEARFAIEAIQSNRRKAEGNDPELALIKQKTEVVDGWIKRIRDSPTGRYMGVERFTITHLNESFSIVENEGRTVTHLLMDAYVYADVRNWGSAVYDAQEDPHWRRAGWFGRIWTAEIIVRKDAVIHQGRSFILASLEPGFADCAFEVLITGDK